MKVINQTKYDTRYLRKLFLACEKRVPYVYMGYNNRPTANYKRRQVKVVTGRTHYVRGKAWLNSFAIHMHLPAPVRKGCFGDKPTEQKVSARTVCRVYLHEIGHNLGLYHKQQVSCYKLDASFWPDENVPLKPAKPAKAKPNVVEVRAGKAKAKLTEWERKLKRAKTYVKKYQKKVRYYERKMAASEKESQNA